MFAILYYIWKQTNERGHRGRGRDRDRGRGRRPNASARQT